MTQLHKDPTGELEYEIIIGLETHVQVLSATKAFCNCENKYGGIPNTRTCPVCLALPGALPRVNARLFEAAALAGLAFGSTVAEETGFVRKNYSYPDLPKGYQISQQPQICTGGHVEIDVNGERKRVNLVGLHMEEDVGKALNIDDGESYTYFDYNRCGAPLIEIVSEPEMRSAEEAAAYAQALREIVRFIGISNGDMEEGSLRCDANVNLRIHENGQVFSTPIAEVKNMNSFRSIRRAIAFEVDRQLKEWKAHRITIKDRDGVKTTRRWDDKKDETVFMRRKGPLDDYRFFPEPDLRVISIDRSWLNALKERVGDLPMQIRDQLKKEYDLSDFDREAITVSRDMVQFYREAALGAKNPKKVANWLLSELMAVLKRDNKSIVESPVSAQNLRALSDCVENGIINGKQAKETFEAMCRTARDPASLIKESGMEQTTDLGAISALADEILAENPKAVEDYRAGKDNALKFLMGQLMKKSKGKANPDTATKFIVEKLG